MESKWSRRSQCQNNNETMRYLTQGDQSNCMNTVMFDPLQFVSEIESVLYKVSCCMHACDPRHSASLHDKSAQSCKSTYHSLRQSSSHTTWGDIPVCFSNEDRGITFNTTLSHNMSCDFTSSTSTTLSILD